MTHRYFCRSFAVVSVLSVLSATLASPALASQSTATAGTGWERSSTIADVYQGVRFMDDGWVEYPSILQNDVVANLAERIELRKVQGAHDGSGCVFEGSDESDVTAGIVTYSSEVAFNVGTCQAEYLDAEFTRENIAQAASETGDAGLDLSEGDTEESDASVNMETTDPTSTGGTKTYTAHHKAMTRDPIQIITSSTATKLTWNVASSFVTGYVANRKCDQYGASGWVNSSCVKTDGWVTIGAVYTDATGKFNNPVFCNSVGILTAGAAFAFGGWGTTYANHSKTRLEGRSNGVALCGYKMNKAGGCNLLLKFDYVKS